MRKTNDTTPLPCPFCGSKKIFRRGPYMHCAGCGCEGPLVECGNDDEVVLAWNRRSKFVEAQNTAHNTSMDAFCMVKLCGNCGNVYPKENHPHTEYHQCVKYKVRLFHFRHHPNLVRAPMCDKNSAESGAGEHISQQMQPETDRASIGLASDVGCNL